MPRQRFSAPWQAKRAARTEARERALEAMCELCEERGYEETTVAAICERAEISSELFGELFEDKEGCLLAVVQMIIGEIMTAFSSNYSADRSEWDSVLLIVRALLEMFAADPAMAYMSYMTLRLGPRRGFAERDSMVRIITSMMDRLWAYSESELRVAWAARAALGGTEAVLRRELSAGRADQLPRMLPDFVYAATVPFLGQEEALRLARQGRQVLAGTEWEI